MIENAGPVVGFRGEGCSLRYHCLVLPRSDLTSEALVHVGKHLLGIFIGGTFAKSDKNDHYDHNGQR